MHQHKNAVDRGEGERRGFNKKGVTDSYRLIRVGWGGDGFSGILLIFSHKHTLFDLHFCEFFQLFFCSFNGII